ncbi:hypothetical protein ACVILI_001924 [Mesorhizobium sp. USDA 4775]
MNRQHKPPSSNIAGWLRSGLGRLSIGTSITPLAIVLMLIVAAAAHYRLEITSIGLRFEPQSLTALPDGH